VAKVLVIEDDQAVRSVICRALQRVGHTVLEGFDGRDGFDQVLRSKVDLVITDILMPNQEGIETIQQLKSLEPDLPIIAMSGVRREGPFSVLDDALMIGADLALEKPFDVPTLIDAVESLLRQREGRDSFGESGPVEGTG
jgi:DNA-binding response OmpR family regulator